jgi:mRNA interferase HigB
MLWYRVARRAQWNDIHKTRTDFPHADSVGKFTVFNIKKNEFRLITVIHYNRFKIYVRAVLTHGEYHKQKRPGNPDTHKLVGRSNRS